MQIRILHIEDEKGPAVTVDDICGEYEENIVTDWFDNFEEGIEKLRQNPFSYNGIILDAKCFLDGGKEDADEQYVTKALLEIEGIFREYRFSIPYCILSGYKEEIEGVIKALRIEAFDKGGQEDDAIDYIVQEQSNVSRYEFEQEFPDLLPLTEMDYLNPHDASTLIQMYKIQKMRTRNKGIIKPHIAQIRPFLERILLGLSKKFGKIKGDYLVPKELVNEKDNKVHHVANCYKYLAGEKIKVTHKGKQLEFERKPIMAEYISRQCTSLYYVSSDIGNHNNSNTGSHNTLISVFYSVIDVLYWYRGLILKIKTQG